MGRPGGGSSPPKERPPGQGDREVRKAEIRQDDYSLPAACRRLIPMLSAPNVGWEAK